MSNSTEQIPSGATHKTPKGTYIKHAAGAWFEWLHEWVKVDVGVHVNVNQLTEISGDAMNPKKLTQAVFEGLPKEYRWAAISETGLVSAYRKKPNLVETAGRLYWTVDLSECKKFINEGFETTNWKNSLIERQDVPTVVQSSFESQSNEKRNSEELHDKPFAPCRASASLNAVLMPSTQGFSHLSVYGDDIDWSKAPEGATHYAMEASGLRWLKADGSDFWKFWGDGAWETSPLPVAVPRPESIHDVACSIEAARVAEKAMPYPDGDERYFETSPVQRDAIQIADAATQHMRDRAATYDRPEGERSMGRAVDAFNAITGLELTESEGWLLLQLLKDVRQWSSDAYHQDSAEDCIAYAALKAEALERGK